MVDLPDLTIFINGAGYTWPLISQALFWFDAATACSGANVKPATRLDNFNLSTETCHAFVTVVNVI